MANKNNKSKNSSQLNTVRRNQKREATRAQEAVRNAAKKGEQPVGQPAEKKRQPARKDAAAAPASRPATQETAAAKRLGDGNLTTRIIAIALGALFIVYVIIQMISCMYSRVSTEEAVIVTLADSIETFGIAVRNEQIITTDKTGVIVSAIETGGKVSKGETVANVFESSEAAHAYSRIAEIEAAIKEFDDMSTAGEDNASEVSSLEKQLRNRLLNFSGLVYGGETQNALELSDDVLYLLNKGQIATKVVESFDGRVAELKSELDSLKKKYTGSPTALKSPLSGYYINGVDGYETLLNTSMLDSLAPEKMDEIIALRKVPDNASVVGKIADDYVWSMVCEVSTDDSARFELNRNYKLYLAYSELDSISAKLIDINSGADTERSLLVFQCTYMVSDLSTVRIQPVSIELSSHTGLEVSSRSIVTRDKEETVSASDGGNTTQIVQEEGVFIVWGNEIKFRKIDVKYRTDDKAICTVNAGRGYLKMYDSVVTDPEEVYDGKIINGG